jgi:hypothetical protein
MRKNPSKVAFGPLETCKNESEKFCLPDTLGVHLTYMDLVDLAVLRTFSKVAPPSRRIHFPPTY